MSDGDRSSARPGAARLGHLEHPLDQMGALRRSHNCGAIGVDLIGSEVLTAPSDLSALDYRARYLAFRMQQIELQRLRKEAGLEITDRIAIRHGAELADVFAAHGDRIAGDTLAVRVEADAAGGLAVERASA